MAKNESSKEKTVEVAKYSKSAFLDAAKDSKERLLLNTLLKDDQTYTKEYVEKSVEEWKSKEVKA